MKINLIRSKYFVINAEEQDKISLVMLSLTIYYSSHYPYLGAWSRLCVIEGYNQVNKTKNQATVNKFAIFCAANTNMPFKFKKHIFDAAVTSFLTYSAESWFLKC